MYNSIVKIEIPLLITTNTFFHIGTGMGNQYVNRTVMKDHEGFLYIPASSLKGKLRNICEELAERFHLKNCSPHGTEQCHHRFTCIICRIFGSKYRQSKLLFDNAYMTEESKNRFRDFQTYQTQSRSQIMINRHLRTAEDGHLFQSEYGLPAISFQGGIKGILPATPLDGKDISHSYELVLLLAGLKLLKFIGGNKSTGCGSIDLKIGFKDKSGDNFIKIYEEKKDINSLLEQISELDNYNLQKAEN
jgi:CRISPR/Cas system CSM-associated protein Csm3 (group 7 of RAMP superfamily)